MKSQANKGNKSINNNHNHNLNHNRNHQSNGFIPNSLKFISSCIKTASTGVRSASASVAASISGDNNHHHKDQVLYPFFRLLWIRFFLKFVRGFVLSSVWLPRKKGKENEN